MDENLTLTPREAEMLRGFGVCRKRIEKKIEFDPRSVRVKGWKARLEDYERAEQTIALTAKLRALGGDAKSRRGALVTKH